MALDIGLSPINNRLVRKILVANLLVFVTVLAAFCFAVYGFSTSQDISELKEKLTVFSASLVDSIDYAEREPDIISHSKQKPSAVPLPDMGVEWYSANGKRLARRGDLKIDTPFSNSSKFETQEKPRALLLTRPAVVQGKLIGYVRVGQSLTRYEEESRRLLAGLAVGVLASIAISSIGIFWLMSQSLKPIEEAFLRLRRFTDDASHELRSPLMAIKSNVSLVLRHSKQLESEYRERLNTAQQAANQMTKLSDDLLLLANADHNQGLEKLTVIDMSKVVDEILLVSEPLAQEKNIEVLNMCNGDGKLAVRGDHDQLVRMLGNVINNALLYTPERGKVSIKGALSGEQVAVQVIDTGIGIAEEDLPKVFERFWRADRARSVRSGGSGLGLAIASALANQHGGNIRVTSKLGEGSCFEITLPVAN